MNRFIRRGPMKILYAPNRALNTPSREELESAIDLTGWIYSFAGFTLIQDPIYTIDGTYSGIKQTSTDNNITFYTDGSPLSPYDPYWADKLFPKNSAGVIYILPQGFKDDARLEIWPVTSMGTTFSGGYGLSSTARIDFYITQEPILDAKVSKKLTTVLIQVYLDDGRVFEYEVADSIKAREHAYAIVTTGYRHTTEEYMEHYPPHRISKVKAVGKMHTLYPDTVRGT